MKNNFEELLSMIKVSEILQKKDDDTEKKVLWILAIVGAIAAVAAITYGVYKYLTPDYLEDFDEDFDEDFYDDLEREEERADEEAEKEGKVSGKTSFVAAKRGDKTAQKVVDNYIRYIGEGLVNLANIFRPDVILLGGAISKERDRLTVPLQKMMDKESFGAKFNPRVEVKIASLQNDAGILGAAALLLQ